MFTRREFVAGSTGLAVAGTAAAATVATDPVVALHKKLMTAYAVASEKGEHAERVYDAIPEQFRGKTISALKVPVEVKTQHRTEAGELIRTEWNTINMGRERAETLLRGESIWRKETVPLPEDFADRLRDALKRLEVLEGEHAEAHREYLAADEVHEKALDECDRLESQLMETQATSAEGIICKVRLGLKQAEFHRPPNDGYSDEKTFLSVIEDLKLLSR